MAAARVLLIGALLAASCGGRSLPPNPRYDGDAPEVAADGGEQDGAPSVEAGMLYDPCVVDSDCHQAFLSCQPLDTTRDQIRVCKARYTLPCRADSDCGPDGFTCDVEDPCVPAAAACGSCISVANELCDTADQCPRGWVCFVPCPCAGAPRCYPPFSLFRCPICLPASDGGRSSD